MQIILLKITQPINFLTQIDIALEHQKEITQESILSLHDTQFGLDSVTKRDI